MPLKANTLTGGYSSLGFPLTIPLPPENHMKDCQLTFITATPKGSIYCLAAKRPAVRNSTVHSVFSTIPGYLREMLASQDASQAEQNAT